MEIQKAKTEEEKVKDFFKESLNPAIFLLKELIGEKQENGDYK